MAMGLKCSLDEFHRRMDIIPGKTDNVAVFGSSVREHNQNLHNLMKVSVKELQQV